MADADRGAAFLDAERAKRPKLVSALDRKAAVEELWHRGLPPGERTGWPSVDAHYTVAPGQMTIVTGWPGSGKSEWLDALLVNLARAGWRTAIFSPENQPIDLHLTKFAEKVTRMPFRPGPTERMPLDLASKTMRTLGEWFTFIQPPEEGGLSAAAVIEAAEPWLERHAKRGLVIDPWNELEHWRPSNLSETEYVSKTLSHVRNWARRANVHVWIVAHPQKMRDPNGKLPVPRPDMISGSQHWWNKADAAITVYRDFDRIGIDEVQIHVQKVRFKHIGRPGVVELRWDRVTGVYSEKLQAVTKQANAYRGRRDDDE